MHDFGTALGVLQLRDVDLVRSDAGLLEGRTCGVCAHTGGFAVPLNGGAEDLEGPESAGPVGDRGNLYGPTGGSRKVFLTGHDDGGRTLTG